MRQDVANNVSINLPIFDCQKHCTSHEKGAIPYAKNAVILCVNLFIPWAELLIVEKLCDNQHNIWERRFLASTYRTYGGYLKGADQMKQLFSLHRLIRNGYGYEQQFIQTTG
jgi:hypothetical protein